MKKVGIIMGSTSDWEIMKNACLVLEELEIPYSREVISAHRTPDRLNEYASTAKSSGMKVLIAGAGGAAHLPGVLASLTSLPVIGVPIKSKALNGLDSLLSIVQMPSGVPVATMAIDGSKNAAIYAAKIIALSDEAVAERLAKYIQKQKEAVLNNRKLTL